MQARHEVFTTSQLYLPMNHPSADPTISYSHIPLPDDTDVIFSQDIWIGENFSISLLSAIIDPVKFSATAIVFIKRGNCSVEINLIEHDIKAPAIVVIRKGQILTPKVASPDFDASYMVMSSRMSETIFSFLHDNPLYAILNRNPVVRVDPNMTIHYSSLHYNLRSIMAEDNNPYRFECAVHTILAFFYRFGHLPYAALHAALPSAQGRIADTFLKLVQENFKSERFLDFYASRLGITTKHLSRTVKAQTGVSAVSWIERYVVLEAQVMLKSSNLNIQQISDELNFKSQSFFGKYFKKLTGMSPKAFRNSR